MNSEKIVTSFEIKEDRLPDYLLNNKFVYQFVNNFLTLLCKINVVDFFDKCFFSDLYYVVKY